MCKIVNLTGERVRVMNAAGHLEVIPPSGWQLHVKTEMKPAYTIKLDGGGILQVVDEAMYQFPRLVRVPDITKALSDVVLPPTDAQLRWVIDTEQDLRIGLGTTYYIVYKHQRLNYRNSQLVSCDFVRDNHTGQLNSTERVLVCNHNPAHEGGQ